MLACLAISAFVFGAVCACSNQAPAADPMTTAQPQKAASASDVQDVFNQRCMPCHATGNPKKGLALDSIEGALKGSEQGPVIVAGDAANSPIIQHMRGLSGKKKMPPMGTPATEEQIKSVENWINAGANP